MKTGGRRGFTLPLPAHRVLVLAFFLLCTALVFDLFDFATRTGALGLPAYWMAAAGLVLGALALAMALHEVPLPIQWHQMQGGALALFAGPLAILLFGVSWALRLPEADIPLVSLVLSMLGAALALATRWRGAGAQAPHRQGAASQPPCASGPPAPARRTATGQDSLPPETGRARAL